MENKKLTFEISGIELERIEEFKKKHRETCTKRQNLTLGEYWTYSFMPTGLGTCVEIKCNLCGETKDVTDIDCW